MKNHRKNLKSTLHISPERIYICFGWEDDLAIPAWPQPTRDGDYQTTLLGGCFSELQWKAHGVIKPLHPNLGGLKLQLFSFFFFFNLSKLQISLKLNYLLIYLFRNCQKPWQGFSSRVLPENEAQCPKPTVYKVNSLVSSASRKAVLFLASYSVIQMRKNSWESLSQGKNRTERLSLPLWLSFFSRCWPVFVLFVLF